MRELIEQIRWRNHIFTLWQFGVSFVLLIAALVFYMDRESTLRNTLMQYEAVQYETDQSEAYEYILQQNMESYNALQEVGSIGTPQRLQWLETIRRLGQIHQLPSVEFTLEGSQITEQNIDPFWHPLVVVHATDMTLSLQLTHEGDLYRLFRGLRRNAHGLYSVESCRLQWLESGSDEVELNRLRGTCGLKWYTMLDHKSHAATQGI